MNKKINQFLKKDLFPDAILLIALFTGILRTIYTWMGFFKFRFDIQLLMILVETFFMVIIASIPIFIYYLIKQKKKEKNKK